MYVDTAYYIRNGKRYPRYLLRESYRENGKVKKRTLATLCRCSPEEITAIKLALAYKNDLAALGSIRGLQITQGKPIGAFHVIHTLARRSGLLKALGNSEEGKRAFWQIYARLLVQGSRQTSLRLAQRHETRLMEHFPSINEKALYKNLAWLSEQQETIEKNLMKQSAPKQIFLYDVTSSYLEGQQNELAAYGYNRDGKKGKQQIVIGLLTDEAGVPVAVRVFEGNTADTKTFGQQIQLLKERFQVNQVVMVGDGGMIKGPQQDALPDDYAYITSLSKTQIRTLMQQGPIQLGLFDSDLQEVTQGKVRYILRRNPIRQQEMAQCREEKEARVIDLIKAQNDYLLTHPKARVPVALRRVREAVERYRLGSWLTIEATERTLHYAVDEAKRAQAAELDGCYCLVSNVPQADADKTVLHDRYKALAKVERAFRTMKMSHLEIRPLYLRKKAHTQGHVFIVMLAYRLQQMMETAWQSEAITVQEALSELASYTTFELTSPQGKTLTKIPEPNALCKKLMKHLDMNKPSRLY